MLQFASQLVFPAALVVVPLPHTVQLVCVPELAVYEPIAHCVHVNPFTYDPAFAWNAVLALALPHALALVANFFATPALQLLLIAVALRVS